MSTRSPAAILGAASILSLAGYAPIQKVPAWADGPWASGKIPAHAFRLELVGAEGRYESADCRGYLDLLETNGERVVFAYALATGQPDCASHGTVLISGFDGTSARYRWYDSEGWALEEVRIHR